MDLEFPLEETADSHLDLEKTFGCADSLRMARVLVKYMMHEMDGGHQRPAPTVQQSIMNSFNVSRPMSSTDMPGSNPTMPKTLEQVITLKESQNPTLDKVNRSAHLSSDNSYGGERSEYSHVKLPGSNSSFGNPYFANNRPSHSDHNSLTHTHPQNNSANPLIHNFTPTRDRTLGPMLDGQPERDTGNQPRQSEIQQNFFATPSLNGLLQQSTGLAVLSGLATDLASFDRDFLNFGGNENMTSSKKPSPHSSTSYPPRSSSRSQNPHIAPQPRKLAPSTTPRALMPLPALASKPPNDREMLQVVEGLGPRNSPFSDATGARSSSVSTVGTIQLPMKAPRKRKVAAEGEGEVEQKAKKAKGEPKGDKRDLTKAKYQLNDAIWMRILEFTPIQFLGKARLISKEFKGMVDQFTSIHVNCRYENYGPDMPPPPLGLTERQYSNLLGSKGCLEPGCDDKNASRTHWSWGKRWCSKCWKSKIEREDRVLKTRGDRFNSRLTVIKLLECIPVGMHDSFHKPHDYEENTDNRPRGAPRLYKYYLVEDVERIFAQYEALVPTPHVEDSTKTAQENATALQIYQDAMAALDGKRADFLVKKKAEIDEHMAVVQKIEGAIRKRRETNRSPYDENRAARKELFTRRAREQLPHISETFVQNTMAFKAATRIFRDGGTERGWQTLKPKIELAYELDLKAKAPVKEKAVADEAASPRQTSSSSSMAQLDGADDALRFPDDSDDLMDVDAPQLRSHPQQYRRSEAEAARGLSQLSRSRLQYPPLAQNLHPHTHSTYGGISMGVHQSYQSHTGMGHAPLSYSLGLSSEYRGNFGMPAMFSPYSTPTYNHYNTSSHVGNMSTSLTAHTSGSRPDPMSINHLVNSNSSASHYGNLS